MKNRLMFLPLFVASLFLPPQAGQAAQVVTNLGEEMAFTYSMGSIDPGYFYAIQFTTGSSDAIIDAATLLLTNPYNNGEATYQLSLFADVGGIVPGAEIAVFSGKPTLPEYTDSFMQVTFTSSEGIAVTAQTSYWLGVQNLTGEFIGWASTGANIPVSSAGWSIHNDYVANYAPNTGWVYATQSSFVPMLSIEATLVPEPTTGAALALGGLLGAGLGRRRQRG